MRILLLILCGLVGLPLFAAYDSALAPYPWRKDKFDEKVEGLLKRLESNAGSEGAFSVRIDWTVDPGTDVDRDRRHWGPRSLKSALNWDRSPTGGYWRSGTVFLQGKQGNFTLTKPEGEFTAAEWWQKAGENIYAKAFSEGSGTVWSFHHDALEADMLAYGEGLGLILWAFQPGEYIRRADNLEVGGERELNGVAYKTLVATPSWIRNELFLENRKHYPFNESMLISWATHRPRVTYFIDEAKGVVAGAEFVYYRVCRSGPKDWKAGSKPNGVVVTCLATEMAETGAGTWYPTKIVGEVIDKEGLLRRTTMAVQLETVPSSLAFQALAEDKRTKEAWPLYRSADYRRFMAGGDTSHWIRFGLARALAFEGDLDNALTAIGDALGALEEDQELASAAWGGVDWELGFALYELFWRYNDGQVATFWDSVPRTDAWLIVTRKAVALFGRYQPERASRMKLLSDGYTVFYEQVRAPDYRTRCMIAYAAELERRAENAPTEEKRVRLAALAQEVREALGE